MSILQNGILNDYNTDITLLDETSYTKPDIYGGLDVGYGYKKGAELTVQLILQETQAAQIAQAISEKKFYNVVANKETVLKKGQAFIRNEDNQAFRITESNIERETPASAFLQCSVAKAEKWELPADMPIIENNA